MSRAILLYTMQSNLYAISVFEQTQIFRSSLAVNLTKLTGWNIFNVTLHRKQEKIDKISMKNRDGQIKILISLPTRRQVYFQTLSSSGVLITIQMLIATGLKTVPTYGIEEKPNKNSKQYWNFKKNSWPNLKSASNDLQFDLHLVHRTQNKIRSKIRSEICSETCSKIRSETRLEIPSPFPLIRCQVFGDH